MLLLGVLGIVQLVLLLRRVDLLLLQVLSWVVLWCRVYLVHGDVVRCGSGRRCCCCT